jgi:hypothetical protein
MIVSRTKLLAAALLVAGGLTLGFGSTILPIVQAQPTPSTSSGKTTGGNSDGGTSGSRFTPDPDTQPPTETRPKAGGNTGASAGQPGLGGSRFPGGADGSSNFSVGPQAARYRYIGKPWSALGFAKLLDDEAAQGYDFVSVVTFENAELRAAAKERPSSFFNIGATTTEVAIFKARAAQAPTPPTPMTPAPPRPGSGFGPGFGPNNFSPNPGFGPSPFPMSTGPAPGPGTSTPAPGSNRSTISPADTDSGSIQQSSTNLKNSDARVMQAAIKTYFEKKGSNLFVAIVPDENRIIVSGNAKDVAEAKKLIDEIDASPKKAPDVRFPSPTPGSTPGLPPPSAVKGENVFVVIALKNADAADIAATLQQVFDKDGPRIVSDKGSNSIIIVRADAKTLEGVKALIEKLDGPAPNATPLPKVKR